MRTAALLLVLCLLVVVLLGGCASTPAERQAPIHPSFESYQRETVARITARRGTADADAAREALLNAPQEWRPAGPVRAGVLLVHGLGDSPWSFNDIGPELARLGFLARTVLLPGHGTRPEDMLEVTLEEWQHVVAEQAAILRRDAGAVVLGGFSTGANLVLDHAYAHAEVAGLLLFSPAFRSSVPFGWVTPWLRHVKPWLVEPGSAQEPLPMRYSNLPTNGFAQFHRSSRLAQQRLASGVFSRPVLMVMAAADSVVDTAHAVHSFQRRFDHPESRLVWYGAPPLHADRDPRLLARPDALPEWRISQFSHMGLLFSPENPLYGREGRLRLCRNGPDEQATLACQQGAEVWFSDWGFREAGKVHARLTFNPYFGWQSHVMADVLDAAVPR